MPISKSAFMRLTAILLVVGLVAIVAIVGTSFWLVERTQVYFEEVVEAREGARRRSMCATRCRRSTPASAATC
jgi:FtsZ-interacting cell division protein ZipA